jgi:putative membrane protein
VSFAAGILIALVALIHLYVVLLETVLWTKPRTRAAFGIARELAEQTKVMAANQGLYNGFLAGGLIWSLIGPEHLRFAFAAFFLGCVILAGVVGAATVGRRVLFVQTVPAALALIALLAT